MKKLLVMFLLVFSLSLFSFVIDGDFVQDEYGNRIELKEYNRFLVIDPSTVEIMYLIKAQEKIVAIGHTARSPIWPEETNDLPTVGTITRPSLEKVISFNPDIVILNSMIPDFGDDLKNHGINVIVRSTNSLDDVFTATEIVGILTGKENSSKNLLQEMNSKMNEIRQNLSENPLNLKGAFLYSTNPIMAFRDDSLSGEILKLLGIDNIANNVIGERPILSAEFILKENPDFLIGAMSINSPEDILNASEIIKYTTAGINKNIFIVDSSKILRPSPRIIDEIVNLYIDLKSIK